MKLRKEIIVIISLLGIICAGCSGKSDEEGTQSQTATRTQISAGETVTENSEEITKKMHVFSQEDMVVTPGIREYEFAAAQELGSVKTLQGVLPGTGEGTWYIIEMDGVEYYYGKYDYSDEIILRGYSIIDDKHSLANGIKVGMKQKEILAEYPDMAVMDFEGNYLNGDVAACMGWNNVTYPRSYIDMDDEWDYKGEDYYWENQFDYIMIADINIGNYDTLPLYVGLLMKDDMVSAITFYNPTPSKKPEQKPCLKFCTHRVCAFRNWYRCLWAPPSQKEYYPRRHWQSQSSTG